MSGSFGKHELRPRTQDGSDGRGLSLQVLLLDHPRRKIRDTQKYKPFKSQVRVRPWGPPRHGGFAGPWGLPSPLDPTRGSPEGKVEP